MASGTINGQAMTRATIVVPRWGIWWADVETVEGPVLSGAVTLALGGASFVGTIVSGGVYEGRGRYRVVAGSGGWRNEIAAEAYRSELGVRLLTVLTDAARAAGETMGTFTDRSVGPAFVRPAGEAARVLDLLQPEAWHVDEAGVTQVGLRAAATWSRSHVVLDTRKDRKSVTIAAEDLRGLVPGVTVGGEEVVAVRHELTPDALRSHLWYAEGTAPGEALLRGLQRLVRATMRPTWYHATYEFRVLAASGGYLDLDPIDTSLGLPPLANVPQVAGVPGGKGAPVAGSKAYVTFANGDPTRPIVVGYEGEAGGGFVPASAGLFGPDVRIGDAAAVALAKASVVASLISALSTFASSSTTWTTVADVKGAATTLSTALGLLPSPSTTKAKGT